jgi:hypothetical protein
MVAKKGREEATNGAPMMKGSYAPQRTVGCDLCHTMMRRFYMPTAFSLVNPRFTFKTLRLIA